MFVSRVVSCVLRAPLCAAYDLDGNGKRKHVLFDRHLFSRRILTWEISRFPSHSKFGEQLSHERLRLKSRQSDTDHWTRSTGSLPKQQRKLPAMRAGYSLYTRNLQPFLLCAATRSAVRSTRRRILAVQGTQDRPTVMVLDFDTSWYTRRASSWLRPSVGRGFTMTRTREKSTDRCTAAAWEFSY